MRSVPLAKINIYNVYSSGIFKYFFLRVADKRQLISLSLSFYINLKRKACALSLSLFLRAHLIILRVKRIVKFINTCPFSLAPAIWFFLPAETEEDFPGDWHTSSASSRRRRRRDGRRRDDGFPFRLVRGFRGGLFRGRRLFHRSSGGRLSLSSSPRWRRRRRGTRRTTPRRRGSLSWIKISELIALPAWMDLEIWIVAFLRGNVYFRARAKRCGLSQRKHLTTVVLCVCLRAYR